jgi:hypothetical protein
MSGFSPARSGGAAVVSASPGFTVKARSTAKARHKDDQARVTAHARSAGRTGKAQERGLGDLDEPRTEREGRQQVPLVPRRENAAPGAAREHVRRDIGSHVAVFELGAPDNPEDLSAPFGDPRGVSMRWAARCLTHHETRYLGDHRAAIQAVKASHTWCAGCAAAIAGNRRIRNRARALRLRREAAS